jgi:hypothetical protein
LPSPILRGHTPYRLLDVVPQRLLLCSPERKTAIFFATAVRQHRSCDGFCAMCATVVDSLVRSPRLRGLRATLMIPSAGGGLPALPMRIVGRARHSVRAVHSQRALPERCVTLCWCS